MIAKLFLIPFVTIFATNAAAQTADDVRLELRAGSELTFEGTSSLHDFSCKTTKLRATVRVVPSYAEGKLSQIKRPIRTVEVVIPVRSITCGNSGLENNLYKTLKADQFPEIRYQLTTYEIQSATDDDVALQSIGELTVAGQEKTVKMLVKADTHRDGSATATATQSLLMTDFGIKPPSFMLGTLKTGNKIVVSFKLNATPQGLASAGIIQ